jgi:hypothetical protein
VLRHSWGIVAVFASLGFVYKYGWFFPNIVNYPGWRILGRISYASFMCHISVLHVMMASNHQPAYLSVFYIVSIWIRQNYENFSQLFLVVFLRLRRVCCEQLHRAHLDAFNRCSSFEFPQNFGSEEKCEGKWKIQRHQNEWKMKNKWKIRQ